MKRTLFIVSLITVSISCISQSVNLPMDKSTGRPYQSTRTDDIQGSEFLYMNWAPAEVTFIDGQTIPQIPVKFDVLKNSFYFMNNDSVFEFARPIRQVMLYPPGADTLSKIIIQRDVSQLKWKGAGKYTQVLCLGNYSLVKYFYKSVSESFQYGNGQPIRQFKDESDLYLLTPSGPTLIKNIKKNSAKAFGSKWPEVQAYLAANNRSIRTEADLVFAVQYLNTL